MSIRLEWPEKDPNEVLDYDIDWSARFLSSEQISTSVWTLVEGDVVLGVEEYTTNLTKVWLSAGSVGQICKIRNRVTTNQGRTMDQTVYVRIKER